MSSIWSCLSTCADSVRVRVHSISWELKLENERCFFILGKFSRLFCHDSSQIMINISTPFEHLWGSPIGWPVYWLFKICVYGLEGSRQVIRTLSRIPLASALSVGVHRCKQSTWQPAFEEKCMCLVIGARRGEGSNSRKLLCFRLAKIHHKLTVGKAFGVFFWVCLGFDEEGEKLLWSSLQETDVECLLARRGARAHSLGSWPRTAG